MKFLKNNYLIAVILLISAVISSAQTASIDENKNKQVIAELDLQEKYFIKAYQPLVKSVNAELLIAQARKLIGSKEYAKAYEMLKPKEYELNENIEFNYRFGVAALRSKKYQDAIYAFNRVSDDDKYHLGSRLDLAIAYYSIGNLSYARKEFVKLGESKKVPAPISKTIKSYIARIDAETSVGSKMKITFSSKAGYSSNINSGYDGDYVYIPILNAQSKLSDNSKKQGSSFVEASVGISKDYEVIKSASLKGSVALKKKAYTENRDLDQSSVAYGISGKYKNPGYELELGMNYLNSSLGGAPNYTTETTQAKITTMPSKRQRLSAEMRLSATKFDNDSSKVNNSTGNALTLSASDLIFGDIGASIGYTHNSKKMDDNTSSNGDSKTNGINLSMRKRLFGISSNVTFGYSDEKYDSENPLFGELRHDATTTLGFGAEKMLNKQKSIDFYIGYRNSSSNIELYNTDNITTSIGYKNSF